MMRAVRIDDPDTFLAEIGEKAVRAGGAAPDERERALIERPSTGVRVGAWEAGAYEEAYESYPVDEFMVLIEGTVALDYPDGASQVFGPGAAFLLPKGFRGVWRQEERVVKYFTIVP
ncbi:MAG: cupin domain-containing protein [Marivibrio sp.]|uniref:cupin domain-containing protein n=1 Tax=Marivibrio sp. TaxID=2039719 RepID=UPI0032EE00F0